MYPPEAYRQLLATIDLGQSAVLVTELLSGERQLYPADTPGHEIAELANTALCEGRLLLVQSKPRGPLLLEPYYPEPKLLVLGAGHLAQPLCEFGARLGFLVTLIDDRPSFANRERFPAATQVICESFERCWQHVQLDASSFVVIATRGHRHDLTCLRSLLSRQLAYLGMVGSKRRVKEMKARLLAEGYASDALARLQAPVGLPIGAVTPEEIAISILAEIISIRRLQSAGNPGTSRWPEQDRQLLNALAAASLDLPHALATIISSRGSVPRNAGAKMLIWAEGRTLGSIGGGCTEAEIIRAALGQSKRHQIYSLDLTGTIAEDAGMVCGGRMEVLVELLRDWNPADAGEYRQQIMTRREADEYSRK